MRRLSLLAALFALGLFTASCDTETVDVGKNDTGHDTGPDVGSCLAPRVPCGEACCEEAEKCYQGACCEPKCEGRVCGNDGCGGVCGTCPNGKACLPDGTCEQCEDEVEAICERNPKSCGRLLVTDLCGVARDIVCPDRCAEPEQCNDTTNTCECAGEPEEELCALAFTQKAAECGTGLVVDRCDVERTFTCPDCAVPEECVANKCECNDRDLASVCERNNKNCGRYQARDLCGVPRVITACGECEPTETCRDNVCVDPLALPRNDACDHVEELTLVNGLIDFETDTRTAEDNAWTQNENDAAANNKCSMNEGGKDVVYSFTLDTASNVSVTATPLDGSRVLPVIFLRSDCYGLASQVICNGADSNSATRAASFTAPALPAGKWFLWVDEFSEESNPIGGLLAVSIQATPVAPPDNERCQGATSLLEGGKQSEEVTGTTAGAQREGVPSTCRLVGGDVYYSFTLGQASGISILLQTTGTLEGYVPAFQLLSACGEGAVELGCADILPNDSTKPVQKSFSSLAAGKYFIAVSSGDLRPGAFRLQVKLGPNTPNDSCDTPTELSFEGGNSSISVVASNKIATREVALTPTCAHFESTDIGREGPEVTFLVNIPTGAPRDLFATVEPTAGSNFMGSVEIRSNCEEADSALSCDSALHNRPIHASLQGVTELSSYAIIVSSKNAETSVGEFKLTVTLAEPPTPPSNDTCQQVTSNPSSHTLAADPKVAEHFSAQGRTQGASDSLKGSCNPFAGGADAIHLLNVEYESDLHVIVSAGANNPGFMPVVYLRSACDSDPTAEVICVSANRSSIKDQMVADTGIFRVSAGLYYIVVDTYVAGSAATVAGSYTIDAYLFDPPIESQYCNSATNITLDGITSHKLVADTAAGNGAIASHLCEDSKNHVGGKELFYTLTLPEGHFDVEITVAPLPGSSIIPLVAVADACGDLPATEFACGMVKTNTQLTTWARDLTGGRSYLLIFDSYQGSADGPFEATFNLRDATYDANTTCWGAFPFPEPDVQGYQTIDGLLSNDPDDHHGRCGNTNGGDLVYKFSRTGTYDAFFTLTPIGSPTELKSTELAIYVRTSCAEDSPDLACVAGIRDNPYSLMRRNVTGDLYVFVDSTSRNLGRGFQLTARARNSEAAPANDECDQAEPLTLDPVTLTASATGTTRNATPSAPLPCGSGLDTTDGPDVLYSIQIDVQGRLNAAVTSTTPNTYKPALYIQRATCAPIAAESGVLCAYSGNAGVAAASANVAPGLYYIYVSGKTSATEGDFGLTLSLQETPAVYDSCASILSETDVKVLKLDMPELRIDSSTSYAANNSFSASLPTAHNGSGADVVYKLRVEEPLTLGASVAFAGYGEAILYLATRCGETGAPELASTWAASGGPANLSVRLEPGSYWLWVDSTFPNQDDFTLKLSTSPVSLPPTATCDTPRELVLTEGTPTIDIATTIGAPAALHGSGGCVNAAGGELVYHLKMTSVAEPRLFRAEVRPVNSNVSTHVPYLYLRVGSCGSTSATDQLVCVVGGDGAASLVENVLQPNKDYWLVVDGAAPGMDYQLTASLHPALPDTCPTSLAETYTIKLDENLHAHFVGDSTGAADDFVVNCGAEIEPTSGGDLVFKLDLSGHSGKDLYIQYGLNGASGALSGFYARVAIALQKGGCSNNEAMTCNSPSVGTGFATLKQTNIAPDVYWIWIDSPWWQNGTVGRYELTVDLLSSPSTEPSPEAAPLTSRCANISDLPTVELDASGQAFIFGDTREGTDDGTGTKCQQTPGEFAQGYRSGKELVYKLVLTSYTAALDIVAAPTATSMWYPNIELRSECSAPASSLACSSKFWNAGAGIRVADLSAGTYFLVADTMQAEMEGGEARHGEFIISVRRASSTFESNALTCALLESADAQQIDPGTTTYFTGNLVSGKANQTPSCGGASVNGPEHIYKLYLTQPSILNATLFSVQESEVVLYLRKTCDAASSELACSAADRHAFTGFGSQALTPGTYYLFADMKQASSNEAGFGLVLEAFAPATNHTCATAQTLTLTNGKAHVEIPEIGASSHTTSGTCTEMPGPELVYKVNVPANSMIAIDVHSPSSIVPGVYFRKACDPEDTSENELFCSGLDGSNNSNWGKQLSLSKTVKLAGEYFLYIDTALAGTHGALSFDLAITPMHFLPENDYCADPFPSSAKLAFSYDQASAAGRIEDASNLSAGKCKVMPGPDKVYSFTLPFRRSMLAKLTAEFASGLYLRSACAERESEFGPLPCATGSANKTITVGHPNLEAGTYYLWVDSTDAAATGAFNLSVSLGDVSVVMTGDTCELPGIPLEYVSTSPTAQKATSIGNTLLADSTTTGTCASMLGGDLYYELHLESAKKVDIKLTPLGSWTGPALVLRTACGDTSLISQLGCTSATNSNALTLTKRSLPAGDYVIWVETLANAQRGEFMLEVTLDTAQALSEGNTCDIAYPLTLGVEYSGNTANAEGNYTWPNQPKTSPVNGCEASGSRGSGLEVVFTYTPTTTAPFTVTAIPNGANLQLWLGTSCDYTSCIMGVDAYSTTNATGTEKMTLSTPEAGKTYYIFMESSSTSGRTFKIIVE